jgi:hypothetical protein
MLCRSNFCTLSACLVAFTMLLSACGGGGGSSKPKTNPPPVIQTGVFVDAVVSGANYVTETQSGTTNTAGEYNYIEGEHVTFSIGGIVLGTALAGPVVTPLMLVEGATDSSDPRVINIVRLLLTLDADGDPNNGLEITAAAHSAATGLSVEFDSATFDAEVQPVVDAVKGSGTQLVDAGNAQNHFDTTLKTSWGTMVWGADCWNQLCQ